MRQVLRAAVVSLIFVASLAAPARAGDETVLAAKVPDTVKASVEKKYPGSVAGRWFIEREGDKEDGKIVVYETKAVFKREVSLRLTPEGKIVHEQEAIPVDKVPEAVKKGFAASMFGKGTIKEVTRIVTDENVAAAAYDFDVVLSEWGGEKGEFRFNATFDSSGRMIEN